MSEAPGKLIASVAGDLLSQTHKLEAVPMGDKSPKAKDKHKKQDTAGKNQKKATAFAKANPAPGTAGAPVRKGR